MLLLRGSSGVDRVSVAVVPERDLGAKEQRWAEQEKEWRERDSLRAAAVKDRRDEGDL